MLPESAWGSSGICAWKKLELRMWWYNTYALLYPNLEKEDLHMPLVQQFDSAHLLNATLGITVRSSVQNFLFQSDYIVQVLLMLLISC